MTSLTKRTLDGFLLDSLGFWTFIGLLTLFAYLTWAIVIVQNHFYFPTAPFTYMGSGM